MVIDSIIDSVENKLETFPEYLAEWEGGKFGFQYKGGKEGL
jgi:hypothetical protein